MKSTLRLLLLLSALLAAFSLVASAQPAPVTPANKPVQVSKTTGAVVDPDNFFTANSAALGATAPVQSVAGRTGAVTLAKGDVGLGNVDNTSDAAKNAAAATLTNKTISGASNTLTNIGNASLTNSSISIAGTSTALGGNISRDTLTGVSSGGLLSRTAANTLTARTLTGTAGQITVTNGDGVSGNPTISLPSTITQATTFSNDLSVAKSGASSSIGVQSTVSGTATLQARGTSTETTIEGSNPAANILVQNFSSTAGSYAAISALDAGYNGVSRIAFILVDDATNHGEIAILTRPASGTLGEVARFLGNGLSVTGTVTATTFSGSGASLTSLNASNLASGTVPDARLRTALYSRGKAVYVDSVNGNDGTGARGRVDLPFLTLTAAKNAAASGDTIYVGPGAYTVSANLAKNGVNWHFFAGAAVTYSGTTSNQESIFDDRTTYGAGEAVVFTVTGAGNFTPAIGGFVIQLTRPTSVLTMQAGTIAGDPAITVMDGAVLHLDAHRIVGGFGTGEDSMIYVRADKIDGVLSADVDSTIYVQANVLTGDTSGYAVQSGDGQIVIVANAVGLCYTTSASATLQITANKIDGIEMSGGTVKVKAQSIGYVFADDAGTDAYIDANEIRGNLAYGGVNAAVHISDGGSISSLSLRIVNARISNSSTSADHYPIRVDTAVCAGLKLQGVTIIANAAVSESIAATSGSKAKIYGAVANKAVSANLTQQVGAVTVDANVE